MPPTAADKKCSTKLIAYPYHVNKFLQCGDEYTLTTADGVVQPVPGQWHTLTSYIKMNTAGANLFKSSWLPQLFREMFDIYTVYFNRHCALICFVPGTD